MQKMASFIASPAVLLGSRLDPFEFVVMWTTKLNHKEHRRTVIASGESTASPT
jgi:hypothetical protein